MADASVSPLLTAAFTEIARLKDLYEDANLETEKVRSELDDVRRERDGLWREKCTYQQEELDAMRVPKKKKKETESGEQPPLPTQQPPLPPTISITEEIKQ